MKKKKKQRYISFLHQAFCLLLLSPALSGCLFEEPEMTADGEMGIDPTAVNVTAEITLDMKLSEIETARSTRTTSEEDIPYRHRFLVEAYLDDMATLRQVVYEDIHPGRTNLSIPISLKLHARPYRLAVWADYVKSDSEDDLYFNTEILDPLITTDPYKGNSEYKDAFYAVHALDLSQYRNQWNVKVPVRIELVRPVARYELVATDAKKFLAKITEDDANASYTVRVKYRNYLSAGFDVLNNELRNSLMYMAYNKTFKAADLTSGKDFTVGVDYVFMPEEGKEIPIEVEVVNAAGETMARTIINITCQRGKKTIVRDNFLTADPENADDDVNIDTEFDDEVDMEVEVI